MQYENWLYGIQVVYLLPVACVVAGLLVASAGAGLRVKFAACAALSVVATFSAANGVLSWLVLLPLLSMSGPRGSLTERKWLAPAWVALMALSVAVYLHGLRATPEHPSMLEALRHPVRAALYFFSFLGAPLWAGAQWVTFAAGLALTVIYALACFYLWRNRGDRALVRRLLGWLMLGAFSLLTGALVTLGRSGFGVEQSETARYNAFSLYLAAAVAHVVSILAVELREKGSDARARLVLRSAALALALALVAQARLYPIGTLSMMYKWREHAREKACTLFVNVLPDACPTARLLPEGFLRRGANALDRVGYLRPPLIRGGRLEEIEAEAPRGGAGEFEELREEEDGTLVASGRARLPGGGQARGRGSARLRKGRRRVVRLRPERAARRERVCD